MLDYLINFADHLGHWGYLVIFLIVALECQALVGLFMPGESLVLAGGFLAGQGVFDPGILIAVISVAAILGDSIGYAMGRHFGREWLLKHGRRFGLRLDNLDRVDRVFVKHDGMAIFTSHFMYLLRALMPFVAGVNRMRYQKFLLFNAAGCTIWASLFVLLGYFAGENWPVIENWIGSAGKIGGGVLLLVMVLTWLVRWLVRHKAGIKRRCLAAWSWAFL